METAIAIALGIVPAVMLLAVVLFVVATIIGGLISPFTALAGTIIERRRGHPRSSALKQQPKPATIRIGRPAFHH